MSKKSDQDPGLYIVHISIHGLIRGENLELGRDADTGGQTRYVVELARALGDHPQVDRVDLLTRLVNDPAVDDDYRQADEPIGERAHIRRIACGPDKYLPKEQLWPHLETFVDNTLTWFRRQGRLPDLIHAHYADAGFTGRLLAHLLGVPLIFTGHSLGRIKHERLVKGGTSEREMERVYAISQRIEAEELTLDAASRVVTSTSQEVEEQYQRYQHYAPDRMRVIPPGVDLSRFRPSAGRDSNARVTGELAKFLRDPKRPMVLALSRADKRKNIESLLHAFGASEELRERANLVIVAGNRNAIDDLEDGAREVVTNLVMLIDRYDLYGRVALPKQHKPDDVPSYYRAAARSRGVFVNPAFTEPFGLTLLEAAASGLPVVATDDGGPRDILANCDNGRLVDVLDHEGIARSILSLLGDRREWNRCRRRGLSGVRKHYSWQAHAEAYLKEVRSLLDPKRRRLSLSRVRSRRNVLPVVEKVLILSLNALEGAPESVPILQKLLMKPDRRQRLGFGIATGRDIDTARRILGEYNLPDPEVIISSVGTEIHYRDQDKADELWRNHLGYSWKPDDIRAALAEMEGLELQTDPGSQRPFKISYALDPDKAPDAEEIIAALRGRRLRFRCIFSEGTLLDVLPVRASKGLAVRYLAMTWGIPFESFLVAGATGNDDSMLSGVPAGIVVANHSPELDKLKRHPRMYFSKQPGAAGLLDGMKHYGWVEEG